MAIKTSLSAITDPYVYGGETPDDGFEIDAQFILPTQTPQQLADQLPDMPPALARELQRFADQGRIAFASDITYEPGTERGPYAHVGPFLRHRMLRHFKRPDLIELDNIGTRAAWQGNVMPAPQQALRSTLKDMGLDVAPN